MAVRQNVMNFLRDGRRDGRPVYRAPSARVRPPNHAFSITSEDVSELRAFVRCLFNTPRQTPDEAWARRKLVADLSGRSRFTSGDDHEIAWPSIGRSDLASHVTRLANATSLWFEGGEAIPPLLAERVQLFLRRSGHLKWEKAFLAVFCFHFATGHDGRYDGLVRRATELRVYPLPRRAAARRRAITAAGPSTLRGLRLSRRRRHGGVPAST